MGIRVVSYSAPSIVKGYRECVANNDEMGERRRERLGFALREPVPALSMHPHSRDIAYAAGETKTARGWIIYGEDDHHTRLPVPLLSIVFSLSHIHALFSSLVVSDDNERGRARIINHHL